MRIINDTRKMILQILKEMNIQVNEDFKFSAESFQIIQLIVAMEEKFDIQFPLEALEFDKLNSVDYFDNIIKKLLS